MTLKGARPSQGHIFYFKKMGLIGYPRSTERIFIVVFNSSKCKPIYDEGNDDD